MLWKGWNRSGWWGWKGDIGNGAMGNYWGEGVLLGEDGDVLVLVNLLVGR